MATTAPLFEDRLVQVLDRSLSDRSNLYSVSRTRTGELTQPVVFSRAQLLRPDWYLPLFSFDAIDAYEDSGLGPLMAGLGIKIVPTATAPLGLQCTFERPARDQPGVLLCFLRETLDRQIRMLEEARTSFNAPVPLEPLLDLHEPKLAQLSSLSNTLQLRVAPPPPVTD